MSHGAFLGTSDFAATVLRRLADSAHRPDLVVTLPDRKRGRGRKLQASPVALAAEDLGIESLKSGDVNAEADRGRILEAGGRWGSICAFGQLIREPLLTELPMLNVHPSLLPRWRGAAPIERAMMSGDAETGVCVMRLVAGLDSGPVALKEVVPIAPDEDFGELSSRLAEVGGELLVEALDLATADRIEWVEQGEDGVTYAEKIDSGERRLDPTMSPARAHDLVRALTPHIGAFAELEGGERLGIRSARPAGDPSVPAGEFLAEAERLFFGCAGGSLEVLVAQPAGGKSMDAASYLRGRGTPTAARPASEPEAPASG